MNLQNEKIWIGTWSVLTETDTQSRQRSCRQRSYYIARLRRPRPGGNRANTWWQACPSAATTGEVIEVTEPTAEAYDLPRSFIVRLKALERDAGWAGPRSAAVTRLACLNAIKFVGLASNRIALLSLPRIAPSVLGGISLQWDFGDVHFVVRVEDSHQRLHYQRVGPGFQQESGAAPWDVTITKLRDLRLVEAE
jgi:hypothetical protein